MIERFFNNNRVDTNQSHTIDLHARKIPAHIAIIMDGNGRWAKQKGLPRVAGHREGMKVINRVAQAADQIGVRYLTLYAFSTENWKRPKTEVDFLMRLPEKFLRKELPQLMKNNVKVRIMGNTDLLPKHTVQAVEHAVKETADNTGLVLNFALNYGGRQEVVSAVKTLCKEVEEGKRRASDIDENMISAQLLSKDLPDPDLLIRTSGEIRLSNFMLWQLAYSEFWFTKTLWPDFTENDFYEAIQVYQNRKRRFGGV